MLIDIKNIVKKILELVLVILLLFVIRLLGVFRKIDFRKVNFSRILNKLYMQLISSEINNMWNSCDD